MTFLVQQYKDRGLTRQNLVDYSEGRRDKVPRKQLEFLDAEGDERVRSVLAAW